jgi:S-adenosylmethionine:tRNA ribosyltransferase-isomerase
MIAAGRAIHHRPSARLLHVDIAGRIAHSRRWQFASFIAADDVVVANDAATLPASLMALHERSQERIELRLAGRGSLDPDDVKAFDVVLFGPGNFRTRTENRPLPPSVHSGDRLQVGSIAATIEAVLDHPRFVRLRFDASSGEIWRMLASHGRPIQYAHLQERLSLGDVWTPIAAAPVAYEPPSAGFVLDWATLAALRKNGVIFRTLTHAAGISSTGDPNLDRRLPLDEPYVIPVETAEAIEQAREDGKRVIAIGTSVVRALEHSAARHGSVRAGTAVADQRIGPQTCLRVVDAILSGTHEAGTSHYELLRAFVSDKALQHLTHELDANEYLTHEFGDSVLIDRDERCAGSQHLRARQSQRASTPAILRKQVGASCAFC